MDSQTTGRLMPKTIARSLVLLMLWLGGVAHAGTVTYVYTDPQGTPLAEADANGNITATFDYAPYGSQALGTAPSGPGYTGHVNDPDTGLVYMQARYYDPVVGRFISTDPVGPAAGNPFNFNRFAYANNSPAVNIDPDGRCTGSLFSECPDGGSVAGPGYIVPFVAPSPSGGAQKNKQQGAGENSGGQPAEGQGLAPQIASSGRNAGRWLRNNSSLSAHGAAAFGPGVEGTATKQLGSEPDSIGGHFVLGEGLYAGVTGDVKVVSWGQNQPRRGSLSIDPSSYAHIKLGAGLSLGVNIDLYARGGSVSISVGLGLGEEAIVKPPATVGGDATL